MHVLDASRAVDVVASLLNPALRGKLDETTRADQAALRAHYAQRAQKPLLTLAQARRNRLTIDWERIAGGVGALRERVHDLYHSGIDRSKLGQWIAAHDLVAAYVPSADGSRWAAERRDLPEADEPKELVDLVKDDEFPLSLFFVQLAGKLEPVLTRA